MEERAEERELRLQRNAADLIKDLQNKLPSLLFDAARTGVPNGPAARRASAVRQYAEYGKIEKLCGLIEPFQEWPQLLDPHLVSLTQPLVNAFLAYLSQYGDNYRKSDEALAAGLVPVPRAVCRIFYILCKVRGRKVISQLLSREPQHLEKILDAFQAWSLPATVDNPKSLLTWEERYVILLWLAHLLLAPFDLTSMSSETSLFPADIDFLDLTEMEKLPLLSRRLLHVAFTNIHSASRERETAILVFVRLAQRTDMQTIGLNHDLVRWCLMELQALSTIDDVNSNYYLLGILAFVADFIKSTPPDKFGPFLDQFGQVIDLFESKQGTSVAIQKEMIKIWRALAVQASKHLEEHGEVLEDCITNVMEMLSSADTSIRFTSSKALAFIAAQSRDIADEILEDIHDDLDETLPRKFDADILTQGFMGYNKRSGSKQHIPSLNVNAMRLHGLILTMSYFAYQRSIPLPMLSRTIGRLVEALHFEQKTALGSSVGANVRDAACFGLWALARKYSTQEICSPSLLNEKTLQALASQLILAAALDPQGNVRRAASAALQEMIGRHPNTINCGEGLKLIQIVDYHAVATRSKSMVEVAVGAASIDGDYLRAILAGFTSWRCLRFEEYGPRKDAAATIRREAACATAKLAFLNDMSNVAQTVTEVLQELKDTPSTKSADRHGLFHALAEIVIQLQSQDPSALYDKTILGTDGVVAKLWNMLVAEIIDSHSEQTPSTMDFDVQESCAALLFALATLSVMGKSKDPIQQSCPDAASLRGLAHWLGGTLNLQGKWSRPATGADAARAFLKLLGPNNAEEVLDRWIHDLDKLQGRKRLGYLAALGASFSILPPSDGVDESPRDAIIQILLKEMDVDNQIELRVHALIWLRKGVVDSEVCTPAMSSAIMTALKDYTIDQRGDIGSLVRLEATDTATLAISKHSIHGEQTKRQIIATICCLACEKLDRVRLRAAYSLQQQWQVFGLSFSKKPAVEDMASVSSTSYFYRLLRLSSQSWIKYHLLSGFVTSAGTGSESLVQVSRTALIRYTAELSQANIHDFFTSLVDIIRNNLNEDRLLIPAMEVLSFLFEAGVTTRLQQDIFPWKPLFTLVAKAHYKSTKIPKIEVAVRIYRGLACTQAARSFAVEKLCTLLRHRYAIIRNAVADALLVVCGASEELLHTNWSESPAVLAPNVEKIRLALCK